MGQVGVWADLKLHWLEQIHSYSAMINARSRAETLSRLQAPWGCNSSMLKSYHQSRYWKLLKAKSSLNLGLSPHLREQHPLKAAIWPSTPRLIEPLKSLVYSLRIGQTHIFYYKERLKQGNSVISTFNLLIQWTLQVTQHHLHKHNSCFSPTLWPILTYIPLAHNSDTSHCTAGRQGTVAW